MNIVQLKKNIIRVIVIISVSIIVTIPSTANTGGIDITQFDNARQETQYLNLLKQLRCLVCQNQTLAESDAPLAKDMRMIIGDMVRTNTDDKKIIDFMVARYGDFVLYKPPVKISTLALWLTPVVLVVIALTSLLYCINRQRRVTLTAAQRQNAARLLKEK